MVWLRFDKKNRKWLEIPKEEKQDSDLYLDRNLLKCLIHYKKQQKKNQDRIIIISGEEGSGKSSIEGNILEFISDTKFNPKTDLVGADYLDGLEKIEKANHGSWLGFDEGNSFFLAIETTKTEHRDLHKIFSIFRQKCLFIIICLPSFFRLGTYFALDRACSLITTYFKDGERGQFAFYGKKLKDRLYKLGKPNYDDKVVKATFRGKFTRCQKLENQDYLDFKKITLKTEIEKAKAKVKKPKTEWEIRKEYERELIKKRTELTPREFAKIFGLTEQRVYQIKKELREGIPAK